MKEKMAMIGKKVWVQSQHFLVECKILDYKFSYGNDRWLVEPTAGKGNAWVQSYIEIDG